jgi:hypothetical protein
MRLLAILAIILWAYQAGAFDSTPGIKEAVELSIHIINEGLSFVMMLLERLFIHVKPQEHWDIFNEWFFNTIPF